MEEGVSNAGLVREAVRLLINSPVEMARRDVSETAMHLEYVSVSDEETMEELETIDRPALVLLAAHIGPTRLIDNALVIPKGRPVPDHLRKLLEEFLESYSSA